MKARKMEDKSGKQIRNRQQNSAKNGENVSVGQSMTIFRNRNHLLSRNLHMDDWHMDGRTDKETVTKYEKKINGNRTIFGDANHFFVLARFIQKMYVFYLPFFQQPNQCALLNFFAPTRRPPFRKRSHDLLGIADVYASSYPSLKPSLLHNISIIPGSWV